MTAKDNPFGEAPNDRPDTSTDANESDDAHEDERAADVMADATPDLALFALQERLSQVEQGNTLTNLLSALAEAEAQGGQQLADALLTASTDDLHDALTDALLSTSGEQMDEQREQPDAPQPNTSITTITSIAPKAAILGVTYSQYPDQQPASQLSPGVQRALTLLFGQDEAGDESAYARSATPPIARVAETREAYQTANETPEAAPTEEESPKE